MSDVVDPQEFGKWRKMLFPISGYEIKKAIPMGIMFFCILFNYTCLRNMKDALVINAPSSGAEVISFLKFYVVMPGAVLFTLLYSKGSDIMSGEKLFYTTIGTFVLFFGLFGFLIYPNLDILHPNPETVKAWQASASEALRWPLALVGNWSYALFFVMSELWGSAALSLLFWQFANQICKTSEAKRFYAFFGLMAQFSLILAGTVADHFSKTKSTGDPSAERAMVQCLMGIVVITGLIAIAVYRWIYKYVLTDKRLYDKPEMPGAKKKKAKLGFSASMKIMVTSPYLGLIAALVLCYGISVNVIEGLWKDQVHILHPSSNEYNSFMGTYSKWTGIVSIFVMIIGGNILRRFSWLTAAMITPLITFVAGSVFFVFILWRDSFTEILQQYGTSPAAVAVWIGFTILILSKSTKYALFDLTKEMAYIPLDEEMKVKGKSVVDVIGGRLGKAGGGFIQSTLLALVGLGHQKGTLIKIAPILFGVMIFICAVWLLSVVALNKRIVAVQAANATAA